MPQLIEILPCKQPEQSEPDFQVAHTECTQERCVSLGDAEGGYQVLLHCALEA